MNKIIEVEGLTKKYDDLVAIKDVTFEIEEGEIFGLLGPNGAGKTTTIEIMEGLRKPDAGSVRINGFNPQGRNQELKEILGVQLQAMSIFPNIKVKEVLSLFACFYKNHVDIEELLELFSLKEKGGAFVKNLSGGEHQKLSVCLAFINDPKILFLDEPTTGLDPNARRDIWKIMEESRERKKTILLTTHYMEEAEELCDRVAIVNKGEILVMGTVKELIKTLNTDRKVEFRTDKRITIESFQKIEGAIIENIKQEDGNLFIFYTKNPEKIIQDIAAKASTENFELKDLHIIDNTLEDVFIKLTRRKID